MAVWLVIAGLLCFLFVAINAYTWGEAGTLLLPMAFVYSFMCLASLYICRAFQLHETPFLKVMSVVVVSAFLSSAVWLALGKGISVLFERPELLPMLNTKYNASAPVLFGIGMMLFALGIVVHYLLLAFDAARAAERQALEMQVVARDAELKALRAQIQPHFLFNSLNSISALTTSDPVAARAMLLRLADFFRNTLRLGQQQFITLEEEFRLAENFLAIEQLRFGERLRFERTIADGCAPILIPSLILQPLVENAVGHGIAHLLEGGTVSLTARRQGNLIALLIANPCDDERPASRSTSVGLANVRNRLDTLYGKEARLNITNGTDFFSVELQLPIK